MIRSWFTKMTNALSKPEISLDAAGAVLVRDLEASVASGYRNGGEPLSHAGRRPRSVHRY